MEKQEKIKLAINGGIGFGAKLNANQLVTISKYMDEDKELGLTTFQQLYIEISVDKQEEVIEEFTRVGLACYPVGNFVKSLRTCNFCKGEEAEGMPVAKELNRRIAGKPVPVTLKAAYAGFQQAFFWSGIIAFAGALLALVFVRSPELAANSVEEKAESHTNQLL